MSKSIDIRTILPDPGEIIVTRDQMTLLMLESHKKSINAAEEIMALKEIAKLHKLYEIAPLIQINHVNIEQNQRKLETMSDSALLEMAGSHPHLFDTKALEGKTPKVRRKRVKKEVEIEAEFTEVANNEDE